MAKRCTSCGKDDAAKGEKKCRACLEQIKQGPAHGRARRLGTGERTSRVDGRPRRPRRYGS